MIDNAFTTWLNNLINSRDKIIHRIAEQQKYKFEINISFWGKSLKFPEKKEHKLIPLRGYDKELNKIAKEYTIETLKLAKNIISKID